jgi:hypothetical protein
VIYVDEWFLTVPGSEVQGLKVELGMRNAEIKILIPTFERCTFEL